MSDDVMATIREALSLSSRHVKPSTPLRDIGKIGVPEAVLQKPDRLTPEEFEQVKSHTIKGAELLSSIPELLADRST